MNRFHIFLLLVSLSVFVSCNETNNQIEPNDELTTEQISFTWKLDSLDLGNRISFITHTISNLSPDTLGQDWTLYYNQVMGGPDQSSLPTSIKTTKINGTFFSIAPTSEFPLLSPNESFSYSYRMNAPIIRKSDVPLGLYMIKGEGLPKTITKVKIQGLESENLAPLKIENASSRFEENKIYTKFELEIADLLIPRPKTLTKGDGILLLSKDISYSAVGDLDNEVKWLERLLSESFSGNITSNTEGDIHLILDSSENQKEGSYSLVVNDKNVIIKSASRAGIMNGISTLSQLIQHEKDVRTSENINLPYVTIYDEPDYEYRGLMLDVARHFHSVESVKSLLDMMAFYKLNKFHFHLGDDEGWRVEIIGLPELTEVGAQRGHTLDEVASGYLQPAYGSGPHHEPELSYGSGWYSKEEYIDILQYAAARNIEVIPEFDMPGHARAAITAMKVRYERYMEKGDKDEAERYLLSDPDDKSEYNSAQGYGDNSFCVCRESTFTFVEKVLQEVIAMHDEAGAPLKTFHSGGDEVGYGSWHKSPLCQAFIKANSESISSTDELQPYFTERYINIISKYGLVTAGWEEYALKSSSEGHNGKELNPKFFDKKMQPYVWNATWGWGREDMAYKLANAGHKVVMCNSAQLYFDMAYNMDPDEPGLMWTGMVDATNPFYLVPEDIYAIPQKKNNVGAIVNDDLFTDHIRLTDEGRKNILGIQGHLWSETVTSNDKIQYYLFPKTLSLSERAWNAYPEWATISKKEERWAAMQKDWGRFANGIGQHHMPILDHIWSGINYRIPLPGISIIDGIVHANVRYPGLTMRFTTDGSDVTENSEIYEAPFSVSDDTKIVKMKSFTQNGRRSRESILKP